ATSRAVVADPWLDANTERPLATFAAQAVSAKAGAARRRLLQDLADRAGVLFFYRQGCAACAQQAGVLDVAARAYGLEILPVALDGSQPPAPFTGFRSDAGQGQRLGVVNTPAVFLVRPPDVVLPLAQGALDLDTLGERILAQAHAAGWVSDADYAATRPFLRPFALPPSFEDIPHDAIGDPARLVAYLRAKLGFGDEEPEP
ncbi:MAG: conjugal transfer protein TraF, partial [Nitrospirota bacterium]|nr:conjugal transfer protein TraF [Nitrospirota bacterium]